jgi:hypothetical protein
MLQNGHGHGRQVSLVLQRKQKKPRSLQYTLGMLQIGLVGVRPGSRLKLLGLGLGRQARVVVAF